MVTLLLVNTFIQGVYTLFFINNILKGSEMLHKFNITTYAGVLCLFGFMLFSAAPVFAGALDNGYIKCQSIKPNGVDFDKMKAKKNCFAKLAKRAMINESECRAISTLMSFLSKTNDVDYTNHISEHVRNYWKGYDNLLDKSCK